MLASEERPFITEIKIEQDRAGGKGRDSLSIFFNRQCGASTLVYRRQNKFGRPLDSIRLGPSGELKSESVHPPIQSLQEIYDPCRNMAPEAFSEILRMAKESQKIQVAIWDEGVDYNHPDLAFRISREDPGYDGEDPEFPYLPYRGRFLHHGTTVAGVVASGDHRIGLIPLLGPVNLGKFDPDEADRAIAYAHQRGARVVNMSVAFATPKEREWLKQIVLKYPDLLFVIAAGNYSKDLNAASEAAVRLPKFRAPNMLVVASVTRPDSGQLSDFSNYGSEWVDIAAWGQDVPSSRAGGGRWADNGTSFAAPQVARAAARMLLVNPNLSPLRIVEILRRSSTPHAGLAGKVAFGASLNEEKAIRMAEEERTGI